MILLTFGNIVTIIIVSIILLLVIIASIKTSIKQRFCKHEKTFENSACDVICVKCGKNLGFIGSYNSKNSKQ